MTPPDAASPSAPVVPAEWAPHQTVWLGFPSHVELWEENLADAQDECAALACALAGPGRERVRLLAAGDVGQAAAAERLDGVSGVEIVRAEFGDVWLRDTGPIFHRRGESYRAAAFRFNGWGGKYVLEHDAGVAEQIAAAAGAPRIDHAFVLEGGAIDHDGFGTVLTTEQCLLNRNRNPGWTKADAEAALADALGNSSACSGWARACATTTPTATSTIWRASWRPAWSPAPWRGAATTPTRTRSTTSPGRLAGARDARGALLQVVRIPSPGRILDTAGEVVPASHMNFFIADGAVVMPVYEERASVLALEALASLFPDREAIGLPSRALLTGGGSFHCIAAGAGLSEETPAQGRARRLAAQAGRGGERPSLAARPARSGGAVGAPWGCSMWAAARDRRCFSSPSAWAAASRRRAPELLEVARERTRGLAGRTSSTSPSLDAGGGWRSPTPSLFANLRMLKPGGRLGFVCWRALAQNELDLRPGGLGRRRLSASRRPTHPAGAQRWISRHRGRRAGSTAATWRRGVGSSRSGRSKILREDAQGGRRGPGPGGPGARGGRSRLARRRGW